MIDTDSTADRRVRTAVRTGPSPLGQWLRAALQRPRTTVVQAHKPRDRTREAERLRIWATKVRQNDPRFADDLFAAADRHEAVDA